MKVWILGSGTLIPNPERGAPAYWLESGRDRVLLDCGAGALRTLAALDRDWCGVSHLLISHFHTDHVGELATLFFALKHGTRGSREGAPLTLLGPRGLADHLGSLAVAHGEFMHDPGFPVHVVELIPGQPWMSDTGSLSVVGFSTRHTDSSLAFRIQTPGVETGALGYTGDTGPDPGLGRLLAGCDLLIAECSVPEGEELDNHLTPESLAELACGAEPEVLVTVHAYPPMVPEDVPDLVRRQGYRGKVLAGADGLAFDIRKGHVAVSDPGT
jgi:ribonuclease BN (tRNA processing enzyme)